MDGGFTQLLLSCMIQMRIEPRNANKEYKEIFRNEGGTFLRFILW
jgi:hypothetical protein